MGSSQGLVADTLVYMAVDTQYGSNLSGCSNVCILYYTGSVGHVLFMEVILLATEKMGCMN